jgi:hypothetical protein
VIRVLQRENRGWQQVCSAMNQLLGSAGNRISDGGGWAVPETVEAAEERLERLELHNIRALALIPC